LLLNIMSIVSFSLANWILSFVMSYSLAFRLLCVFCTLGLFDLFHLRGRRSRNLPAQRDGFTRGARFRGNIAHISQSGRRNSSTASDHEPGQEVFFFLWKHASLAI
jgi:hypothetical protein